MLIHGEDVLANKQHLGQYLQNLRCTTQLCVCVYTQSLLHGQWEELSETLLMLCVFIYTNECKVSMEKIAYVWNF